MLRLESTTGWWLITHPDHAALAAHFAARWGNAQFPAPEPRTSVLRGIAVHDDGWAARDAHPKITRQGKPSAFSHELVGAYSAFEEIDLTDYLAVREAAVQAVEQADAYAALLVSMHTCNLLTERADRSTISAAQLPLLDDFLTRQRTRQRRLCNMIRTSGVFAAVQCIDSAIEENFRLLQATDNLSLLSCVAYRQPSTLLHSFATTSGVPTPIAVQPLDVRRFRLIPYPFDAPLLNFTVPARHVEGKSFATDAELAERYAAAVPELLPITVCA